MKTARFILLIIIPSLFFAGCNLGINESYWIKDGETSHGSKNTINGNIRIGENSEVTGDCRTINGSIDVGSNSRTRDIETINGNISVGKDVMVRGDIKLINGSLHCASGVKVTGEVENINGEIKLEGTHVEDDLSTYNGDIRLYDNTIIRRNIIIKERHGFGPDHHDLLIEIDDSTVDGDIINKDSNTDVTVYLSRGGKVLGRIKDARVVNQ